MNSNRVWHKAFVKQFLARLALFLGVVVYGLAILFATWFISGLMSGGGARWFLACMKFAVLWCQFFGNLGCWGC